MSELPVPIGKQREVLYLPPEGHTVVLGTAGSGKTTLAILRSVYLSDSDLDHGGKTLLVTFNKTLVTYLKYLRPSALRNVTIENYHKFARGYLNSRGKIGTNTILDDANQRIQIINAAIVNVKNKYEAHKFFERPIGVISEEIRWILSHGIPTKNDYIAIERIGLQSRIPRITRSVMYEILLEYLRLRKENGKEYDWDDLALHANNELIHDDRTRLYKHIVIDEGQDFSPEMLRSLTKAIAPDGSLTFFGDVAQQIYGQRMSWRSAGFNVQKVWEFKENYRNTKEIARLGLAIAKMPYFKDIPDMVEPTAPRAEGELPVLVKHRTQQNEIGFAVRYAIANAKNQRVAILFKNREQERLVQKHLPTGSIRLHREMTTWQSEPGISFGTYHSAKGLEFDLVILPFLSKENLPDAENVITFGIEEVSAHDGKLLYVAITRARTRLILMYSGQCTELLPSDETLYNKVNQ